jgi:sugar lactone lactonase YvrE
MANQTMERALRFAGYEVEHRWSDGKHDTKHATEIFPEAMKWLWKDWPKPVGAGAGSPPMQEILVPGEGWRLIGSGYQFTEGPAAAPDGSVVFSDVRASKTYRVDLEGTVSTLVEDSKRGNGQAFGADGTRFIVATGTEQVLAFNAEGGSRAVAEGFRGNDLVVRHDGSLYVTAPGAPGTETSRIFLVDPKGQARVVDEGLKFSNGVALSPDQSLLYVADSRTRWVYSYQIQADGSLAHKQKYYHLHVPDTADDSGADGMEVDRDGRLYVATRMGVQVCDQAGRVNCIIPTPNGRITNLAFGGKELDTLYATCGDKVYARKVKTRGLRASEGPLKPAAPRL